MESDGKTQEQCGKDATLERSNTCSKGIFLHYVANVLKSWVILISVFTTMHTDFTCSEAFDVDSKSNNISSREGDFNNTCIDGCSQYVYDVSKGSSITAEFNLGCENGPLYRAMCQVIFWLGYSLACVLSNPSANDLGPKGTALSSLFLCTISSFSACFAPTILFYIIVRFFDGCFMGVFSDAIKLMTTETNEETDNSKIRIGSIICTVLGYVICTITSYLLSYSWKLQHLALSFAMFASFCHFVYFTITDQEVFRPYKEQRIHENVGYSQEEEMPKNNEPLLIPAENPIRETFPKPQIVKNTRIGTKTTAFEGISSRSSENGKVNYCPIGKVVTWIIQFSVSVFANMVYYGIIYGVERIHGNIYVNSAVLAAADLPSSLFYSGIQPNVTASIKISRVLLVLILFLGTFWTAHSLLLSAFVNKSLALCLINLITIHDGNVQTRFQRDKFKVIAVCGGVGAMLSPIIFLKTNNLYDVTILHVLAMVNSIVMVFMLGRAELQ